VFPFAVALVWALVIGAFSTVGRLFGPEGEQGTWAEVAGATAGNFALAFVAAFVLSVLIRSSQRKSGSPPTT
jgi:hypothetical protein